MKLYYVYMLKCSDNSIYTGMTNSIDRRLDEHNLGRNKNCYTYKRRPLKLIFHQEFNDVNQAIFFEKKIKKWSWKKKIALANGDFDMLKILAECQNATHYKYNPGLDCARPDMDQMSPRAQSRGTQSNEIQIEQLL